MTKKSRQPARRRKEISPKATIKRLRSRLDAVLAERNDEFWREFVQLVSGGLDHANDALARRSMDWAFVWIAFAAEHVMELELLPELSRASSWQADSIRLQEMMLNRAKKAAPEGGKARAAKFAAANSTLISEALKLRKSNRHLSAKDIGVRLHPHFPDRSASAIARVVGPHLPKRNS